jgi:hypothetical protein
MFLEIGSWLCAAGPYELEALISLHSGQARDSLLETEWLVEFEKVPVRILGSLELSVTSGVAQGLAPL